MADQLDSRIDELEANISKIQAKIRTSAKLTLVVGLLAMGGMSYYFYHGYTTIKSIIDPNELTDAAIGLAEANLPTLRKNVEEQIETSAPDWAAALSDQALKSVPTVREKLEGYVVDQTEDAMGQVQVMTTTQFRKILKENRDILQEGFTSLASEDQLPDEVFEQLEAALEKELKSDMQESAGTVLETLTMLNGRLQRLHKGVNLNEEEKLERQILMRAKRLQLQEADTKMAREKKKIIIKVERSDDAEGEATDAKEDSEKPADEKPADEKPADEKPADQKPADEKPAEKKEEEKTE